MTITRSLESGIDQSDRFLAATNFMNAESEEWGCLVAVHQ